MGAPLKLGSVGATYGGLTGKTKADFGRGDAPYISFLEVVNNTRLKSSGSERVRTRKGERQNRIQRGDLLFNGSSETPEEVALSSVVAFEPKAITYLNSFCFGYRLKAGAPVDPTFLAYYFRSGAGRAMVSALAQGATRYNIAKTKFLDLEIDFPAVADQRRMVDAMTDADDLIASLERLIEKKQAIKQGMMQQLLTGRVRLSGFTAAWRTCVLGDLLAYEQPTRYLVSSTDYADTGTPVLTAGKTFVLGYTSEREGIFNQLPTIIFDDFTTASKYVDFAFKAKSSAMKMLSAQPGVNLRYMYERMQLIDFVAVDHKRRWIAEYSKIEVDVPDKEEQDAIATVLDDADREIDILARRLAKARAIRTGMMQQLLTGRVRLPVEAVS